jgi:hypothetical protein
MPTTTLAEGNWFAVALMPYDFQFPAGEITALMWAAFILLGHNQGR